MAAVRVHGSLCSVFVFTVFCGRGLLAVKMSFFNRKRVFVGGEPKIFFMVLSLHQAGNSLTYYYWHKIHFVNNPVCRDYHIMIAFNHIWLTAKIFLKSWLSLAAPATEFNRPMTDAAPESANGKNILRSIYGGSMMMWDSPPTPTPISKHYVIVAGQPQCRKMSRWDSPSSGTKSVKVHIYPGDALKLSRGIWTLTLSKNVLPMTSENGHFFRRHPAYTVITYKKRINIFN